jgi:hypothetical protein
MGTGLRRSLIVPRSAVAVVLVALLLLSGAAGTLAGKNNRETIEFGAVVDRDAGELNGVFAFVDGPKGAFCDGIVFRVRTSTTPVFVLCRAGGRANKGKTVVLTAVADRQSNGGNEEVDRCTDRSNVNDDGVVLDCKVKNPDEDGSDLRRASEAEAQAATARLAE